MIAGKKPYGLRHTGDVRKMPLFPEGMIFGASTSAYQVEGAAGEDGRGPSIWDSFNAKKNRPENAPDSIDACSNYHKYIEDISVMGRLGLGAYRFSISWPRVFPAGRGAVNEKGLSFYDKLTDELLKAGIRPFATLYHWDFPDQLFRETGGFLHRSASRHFADYAETVVKRLGDRIKDWVTINDPWTHSTYGYVSGRHAPGLHRPLYWGRTVHNQLLAHAYAMERIKALRPAARVGLSLGLSPVTPAGTSAADRSVVDLADQLLNSVFLDPLFKGEYPAKLMSRIGLFWPEIKPADMELISRPMNFLGINLYSRARALYAPWVPLLNTWIKNTRVPVKEYEKRGSRYTAAGREVYPESMYQILVKIRDGYGNIPVYITENGAAFTDKLDDYRVRDANRVEFIREYTAQAARAAEAGCDIRGLFISSLLDCCEWIGGFKKRSGIVYVDYKSQKRFIKDSGYWYKDLILANKR